MGRGTWTKKPLYSVEITEWQMERLRPSILRCAWTATHMEEHHVRFVVLRTYSRTVRERVHAEFGIKMYQA